MMFKCKVCKCIITEHFEDCNDKYINCPNCGYIFENPNFEEKDERD